MRYSIRTVTPPGEIAPVIDVAAAKEHLRVAAEFGDDDALIGSLVAAAQRAVENYTSRLLTPRTMEMAFAAFPCAGAPIVIPRDPVTEIVSLKYTSSVDGGETIVDSADWRWSDALPDRLLPAFGGTWPSAVAAEEGAARLRFVAGYEEGLCEGDLTAAVKLLVGHLYMNREASAAPGAAELPFGVASLCAPYRRVAL